MILLNKVTRLYHFTRPLLSSVRSLKELESIIQKRLVKAIKKTNKKTLEPYSFTGFISDQLKVDTKPATLMS